MPPLAGYWHSLLAKHGQVWKAAYKEASKAIESKLSGRVPANVEHAYARVPVRQAVHPAARIRQGQSGWLNTKRHFHNAVRYLTTETAAARSRTGQPRSAYQTATWTAIKQSPGRAPFASTLRPNLTGGTLGRTAGGYSLGAGRVGAQRYFSHGPAGQTQVIQNVSQAMRAFLVGGQKAQFNGVSPVTGNKTYKKSTQLQADTSRRIKDFSRATPGSYVSFNVNPTITALTPLRNVTGYSNPEEEQHLNSDGLLDILSTDFSRQLQELCVVLADLKRLSTLGDLPISYEDSSLRIHFPGCDADTIERLCQELNVKRGLVIQDQDFDAFVGTEIALLFPFAPSIPASEAEELFDVKPVQGNGKADFIDWQQMLSPSEHTSGYSTESVTGMDRAVLVEDREESWLSSHTEDESYNFSDEVHSSSHRSPLEYHGIEGIYRFIEQCDNVRK